MSDRDGVREQELPNFGDALAVVSKLVPPDYTFECTGDEEIGYPDWNGNIRKLDLEPDVAEQAGLGESVRVRVIGDYQAGIAMIMRSRNIFDTRRYGFYIQSAPSPEGPSGIEVWQSPAQKPQRGKVYWGIELLDLEQAQQSSPEVTKSLIESLRRAAE